MDKYENGLAFENDLLQEIRDKFYYVDEDFHYGKRLFFDNAGGSYRLKKAVEIQNVLEAFPDCPERDHKMSYYLQDFMKKGQDDIRTILNAKRVGV